MTVAVMVLPSDDEVFDPGITDRNEKEAFIEHILKSAEHINPAVSLLPDDRFVLLSTCAYDYDGASLVLITKQVSE